MKLSPLREALEAGKTLLGDELPPLDLDAARLPNLPEIIPTPAESEAAAPAVAAQPTAAALPDQDTPMLDAQPEQAAMQRDDTEPAQDGSDVQPQPDQKMVSAQQEEEIPSPEAATKPAEDLLEEPVLASPSPWRGSARGRGRGRGARGRSGGRGKGGKRKVVIPASALPTSFLYNIW